MTRSVDLVVVGSGAGGLSAAVTAAAKGLSVTVLEKAEVLGGTTALSGGWIWAPRNPIVRRAGITEPAEAPRNYLQEVLGNRFEPERVDAFLAAAPEMVEFFEAVPALEFEPGTAIPDTYGHLPGAGTGGRSVIAKPFDGSKLGADIELLRLPARETTFLGMTIQAGPDLRAFMTMTRSPRAFLHATRRVMRHVRDLALHGRGMDLRNGNALVARLLRAALDLGVELRPGCAVRALQQEDGSITGVALGDGTLLHSRVGVVLATGGYPHDAELRAETVPRNAEHRTLAIAEARGDGIAMARGIGAQMRRDLARAAALCPVSVVPWPDGKFGTFPHIIERGKPGVIGVLANGKRFCNEGLGYHDYVDALLGALPEHQPARSWLVCDFRFLRRFGLGVVRPQPLPWRHWVRRGYLKTGRDLAELARACGIDAAGLEATVAEWNRGAARGEDPLFHRGTTPYMRLQGDPEQHPNPCVAAISRAPFFAVEVVPGSFGTFCGLATNGRAQVLDTAGAPIPGLWAAGTDMASVFGGHYPAGGINLGPAMTFGFIAGRDAAARGA